MTKSGAFFQCEILSLSVPVHVHTGEHTCFLGTEPFNIIVRKVQKTAGQPQNVCAVKVGLKVLILLRQPPKELGPQVNTTTLTTVVY